MSTQAVSISGPLDVIQELAKRLAELGVLVSDTTELDAADVLNAPWNKAKVVAIAGVVTAVLELGAGAVSLADEIANALHSPTATTTTVIVIDNATQPTAGQAVSPDTTAAQIQAAINAALDR
jgi:hypothetical protein